MLYVSILCNSSGNSTFEFAYDKLLKFSKGKQNANTESQSLMVLFKSRFQKTRELEYYFLLAI